jgi:hypothetical protein
MRQGAEFQVNAYTVDQQQYPSIATDADGDFVIGWYSNTQDGSSYGVFARRFSSAGASLASEFQVNSYTLGGQQVTSVDAGPSGGFVVAWSSPRDGAGTGIMARRFSSDGAAVGDEFQVNTFSAMNQKFPSVAVGAGAAFVIGWQSDGQDGSDYGLFVQRLAAVPLLDVDGDGTLQPLTDGLLVVRAFFGFTGTNLTTGAVGGDCTRCSAAAIQAYLASVGLAFDVDGNTTLGPLTDGLLILRFLFGFTGSSLTSSAVDESCTRCDATSIQPYLAALTI